MSRRCHGHHYTGPQDIVDSINNSFILHGQIINEQPRRNGYIGDFKGVPVVVRDDVPEGKIYFLNDNIDRSWLVDTRSRWQIFVDSAKRLFKRR